MRINGTNVLLFRADQRGRWCDWINLGATWCHRCVGGHRAVYDAESTSETKTM